jgi:hypothetical protein
MREAPSVADGCRPRLSRSCVWTSSVPMMLPWTTSYGGREGLEDRQVLLQEVDHVLERFLEHRVGDLEQ